MLGMVPYHRPKSGHITCYLNRTYHVLLTVRITTNIQHLQNVLASVGALFSLDKDAACRAAYRQTSQRGGSRGGCTDKVSRDARRSVSRTSTRRLVSFPLKLVPGAQRRLRTLRSPAAAES